MFSLIIPFATLASSVVAQRTEIVHYVSEPNLSSFVPTVEIGGYDGDDGLYLTTPLALSMAQPVPSSMAFDRNGSLVWVGSNVFGASGDLQLQEYDGKPVLTAFNTSSITGLGAGTCWIADETYTIIGKVSSVGGKGVDGHECNIAKDTNTSAVITVYNDITPFDLTSFGGPVNGTLTDCWVQEIDIKTGALLFNWSFFDHVSPYDSYMLPSNGTWDAYHMNSIDKSADGSYLVSSRHLSTLFEIAKDGSITWRMGGQHNNFTIGDGASFSWQHHARYNQEDESYISLFDDTASDSNHTTASIAHGLYISYNTSSWTTTAHSSFYPAPFKNYSTSQGSFQRFTDGSGVVGYGSNPWITEHDANGTVIFSLTLGAAGDVQNYRAFKLPAGSWNGNPSYPPALALQNGAAYFSWNGKTAVRAWDVLGDEDALIQAIDRAGFETSIIIDASQQSFVSVVAKDGSGKALGRSTTLYVANGTVAAAGQLY